MARLFRVLVPALVLGLAFAACGDDDDDQAEQSSEPQAAQSAELGAIKDYLLEHTERLVDDTAAIRAGAEEYYELAEAADFDYAKLLADNREDVQRLVKEAQDGFRKANPSYEEMEGVVAGVPVAGRVRRDHRRRQRRQRSRERRAVRRQDAVGAHARAARQLQLPGRDQRVRHRGEVPGQGRGARPRRRRQGRVRRVGARRRPLRGRHARLREVRQGAGRGRARVGADRAATRSPRSW